MSSLKLVCGHFPVHCLSPTICYFMGVYSSRLVNGLGNHIDPGSPAHGTN